MIRALLGILSRTSDCKLDFEEGKHGKSSEKVKRKSSAATQQGEGSSSSSSSGSNMQAYRTGTEVRTGVPTWLSISLDAALGCRANVFQIQRSPGKKHASSANA